MKIYFAGAIRGGRRKARDYEKIVKFLLQYGVILTNHVADPKLTIKGEDINPIEVYERDRKLLNQADIIVAEVTIPSLGVGYELAYGETHNKTVICCYEAKKKNISAMVLGNQNFIQISYTKMSDLFPKLDAVLSKLTN